jgi:hypothetical protein
VLCLLLSVQNYPQAFTKQQLDSLYTKFLLLRAPEMLDPYQHPEELTFADRKCGFGIVSAIRLNLDFFSPEQQIVLKEILQRPTKQTSIVSPSGFFRIHFDTTGNQTPRYNPALTILQNVQHVAIAADSAYNFEVNYLGYPPPPYDFGEGGDNLYDIYIGFANGSYGFTEPEINLGNEKYTSFMEIHYSFANFYTTGLAAMRATVAHELHHGIQVGNYILRWEDQFFYELTSTSMEEFVYDDVNDYYAYMNNYFSNPAKNFTRFSLGTFDGYDLAIWNIYLQKNFDFDIIKRQWELMPSQRAILAIGNSILERGSTFAREYNKFGIWIYYTGYRAIPNSPFFEEAAYYPLIKPLVIIPFNNSYPPVSVQAQPTSNNFLQFNISPAGDTLFAIVTNGNLSATTLLPSFTFDFSYTLFSNSSSGNRKLTEEYSADFNVNEPNWWSVSEILNGLPVRVDSTIIPGIFVDESFAFPNPFRYKGYLSFFIEGKQGEALDFNLYSSDLSLVYSSQTPATLLLNNSIGIVWNGIGNDGKKLASGVYIYIIKKGDEIIKGKVVIFNE